MSIQRNNFIACVGASLMMLLLSNCSGVPSGVIPPSKMSKIMADIHTAEAVVEQNRAFFSSDSMKLLLRQSIYSRYGVTVTDFDSSMMWYGRNLDKFSEVYDKTIDEIQRRIDETSRLSATEIYSMTTSAMQFDGDSVDVWQSVRQRSFGDNMSTDNMIYELRSTRYWENGDIYRLRLRISDFKRPVIASVVADYPDGSTEYVVTEAGGDGWYEATLMLNPDMMPTMIYGSITSPRNDTADMSYLDIQPMLVDSVSLVRMRRTQKDISRQLQLKFHHQ